MYHARDMTLCIGARASVPIPLSPCIVLCFDTMVANEAFGSESEQKFRVLSDNLVSLYAGSPARAKELAMIYQSLLKTEPLPTDPALAIEFLRRPLAELKRRLANSYSQARLAVGYEELKDNGEKWFGTDRWQRHLQAIDQHDPNVQVIIAGFIGGTPVLYQTSKDSGSFDLEAVPNYCLIGTGSFTAEPALHARKQLFTTSVSKALYNVYEAKRAGESSPFVGKETVIFVLHPESKEEPGAIRIEVVSKVGYKALDKIYRKHGPKPMPTWPDLPDGSLQSTWSIRGRATEG